MLFQLEFRQDVSIDDTLLQYYTMDADSSDDEEEIPEVKLSQKDREYIDAVIKGVGEKKSELDSVITEYAKGWSLERDMTFWFLLQQEKLRGVFKRV